MKIVELECSCGTVKGRLKVVPGSFFHVHCLCRDCQKFAGYLQNKDKILDEHGGSELFQTYPAYMEITEGQEQIRGVQLTHKGIYRWYCDCCKLPLANTLRSAKVPFVGVSVKLMKFASEQQKIDILGPVTLKAFGKYAIGDMPKDAHMRFPRTFLPKILAFMAKGFLGAKSRPSPFFIGDAPVAKVHTFFDKAE
ncbi:DUF6151 family protein [Gilvimarinus algae]|uniref:DUF6151 family protein n=1 Tax=Gilvimarinus algae TaxID=3058037 RepID=A0ABT8TCJ5_9GAMM|nr:DUF6151 family protein [Gilvimarinus sp. SDUM040014]MDO3381817.1 DUF6151 family protein [Gilvimarinus sp. SDUM040014]